MMGHLPFLAIACWFALALLPQGQDLGDAQIIEEDYRVSSVDARQKAVENLQGKVDELRKSGQLIEAARTLNRVGRFQIRMSVAEDAVSTFQESLTLLQQQPDFKTQIDSLNGLAASYGHLTKCELSEPSANQALTLSKQNNYVAGEAGALLILSDCQNSRDHALALKTAQESLALWSSIDRKRGMADAYAAIGHYHLTQHNIPECSRNLEAALNIFRELADPAQQADVLISLGYVEHRIGAWQSALNYYIQAQSLIDKEAEPLQMGRITIGLGDAFLEIGMPEVALAKYLEALDYFRISKHQRAVSIVQWSIGKANYFSGKYEDAINSLQTARSEAHSSGDVTLTAFCDDFLGRAHQGQKNYPSALSYFQSAQDGYSKAKNTREAVRVLALMGQLSEQQGRFQEARDNYQTALNGFRSVDDRVNESATLYALGNLELHENNLDKAGDYLQKSIEVTEQMRRVSTSSDLTAAFSARVHDRYERYIEYLMRKHQANPDQGFGLKAFETSELARARSLTELLLATQTNLLTGVDPKLAEQEKMLRQSLRVKEDYKVALLGRTYKKEELDSLKTELADLEAKHQQVTEAIQARYPAYNQITRPTSWSLNDIQQQVIADEDTVLVEYSLGRDKSYLWAVTRDHITSYQLPNQDQINEAAQKVYKLLSTQADGQGQAELTQTARELAQMILAPAASDLNKRRMIVVADGVLNYIPFQILPVHGDTTELLVANHEVINVPSASILGQLRVETTHRRAPEKTLAAFGDPVFAANFAQRKDASSNDQVVALQVSGNELWPQALRDVDSADGYAPTSLKPLFYVTRELANLRAVAGPEALLVTGFDATRENLKSADLTKYAILHFATHGVLDPKRPEYSGLFLSMVNRNGQPENGFVGLQDIYGLRAPVDLVVLSACRTGLGKDVRGEGLIGLTRGFMYAGASSVMASLWKVDDEATSELMKRFYTNMLERGMTPAAALRAAQNDIRSQPQWSSPYYWAAFTLQGEYRQVIRPASTSPTSRRILVGVVLLAFFGGASWWFIRRRRAHIQRSN